MSTATGIDQDTLAQVVVRVVSGLGFAELAGLVDMPLANGTAAS